MNDIGIEWFSRVVAQRLDNPKAFGPALPEKYSIANSKVFGPLDEAEGNGGAVTSSDECSVNIDDGTSLGDWTNMKHSLILGLYGGCMAEDKY